MNIVMIHGPADPVSTKFSRADSSSISSIAGSTKTCHHPHWTHSDYTDACIKSFRQFFDSTACSYDSHLMATEGHLHTSCEFSTFSIAHQRKEKGELHCHPRHGCYNEANNEENVALDAHLFCLGLRNGKLPGRIMKPGDHKMHSPSGGIFGVEFFADWIEDSELEDQHGIADKHCAANFYSAWKGCINGGRGKWFLLLSNAREQRLRILLGGWHRVGCVALGMRAVCD